VDWARRTEPGGRADAASAGSWPGRSWFHCPQGDTHPLGSSGGSARPRRCSVHAPPAWQDGEGRHGRRLGIHRIPAPAQRALGEVQSPAARPFHPRAQALAPVGHVGPDVPQPLAGRVGGRQEPRRRSGAPQVGGVDEDTPQETHRVHEAVARAAVEFRRPIRPMRPPVHVVFTAWAALRAAEGCG
jgi:hypothetical protein